MSKLPENLQVIVDAIDAGDRPAYDAGLEAALQEQAFEIPEADYIDGMETDALAAAFQTHGYDGIPDFSQAENLVAERAEDIRAARRANAELEALRSFGVLMFGSDWQRATARALGPHHPSGSRDAIDDRLVRRWVAGERDVPVWVRGACKLIVENRIHELQTWLATADPHGADRGDVIEDA